MWWKRECDGRENAMEEITGNDVVDEKIPLALHQ